MRYSSTLVLGVLWVAGLAGCATEGPRFVHNTVRVPAEYQGARTCPGIIPSDHERYVESFEWAWWNCLRNFTEDIDYQPRVADRCGNGWPSAWAGHADGFADAEGQVRENIRRFGKTKTHKALEGMRDGP